MIMMMVVEIFFSHKGSLGGRRALILQPLDRVHQWGATSLQWYPPFAADRVYASPSDAWGVRIFFLLALLFEHSISTKVVDAF